MTVPPVLLTVPTIVPLPESVPPASANPGPPTVSVCAAGTVVVPPVWLAPPATLTAPPTLNAPPLLSEPESVVPFRLSVPWFDRLRLRLCAPIVPVAAAPITVVPLPDCVPPVCSRLAVTVRLPSPPSVPPLSATLANDALDPALTLRVVPEGTCTASSTATLAPMLSVVELRSMVPAPLPAWKEPVMVCATLTNFNVAPESTRKLPADEKPPRLSMLSVPPCTSRAPLLERLRNVPVPAALRLTVPETSFVKRIEPPPVSSPNAAVWFAFHTPLLVTNVVGVPLANTTPECVRLTVPRLSRS